MEMKNAKDIKREDNGTMMLLYSLSGEGKTHVIKTMKGRTLILDIERKTQMLDGMENVDIITISKDLTDLKDAFEYIEEHGHEYDLVVIDSITELQTHMILYFAKQNEGKVKMDGVPTQADYNRSYLKIENYIRSLRDLKEKGVNVLVTALETWMTIEEQPGMCKTMAFPAIFSATKMDRVAKMIGVFDVCAQLKKSTKEDTKGQRFFILERTSKVMARNGVNNKKHCEADLMEIFK